MIRIQAGQSWKLNPSYVSALRGLGAQAASRFSPSAILDALGVEIDGVDISRGHAEAALVPAVLELCAVVLRLCHEPAGRGQVALVEGRAELVLGRRGGAALLCLVSLARPARLLAGELEVELHALARATARCALGLAVDLESINPALASNGDVRALRQRAAGLQKAARLGGEPPPERDRVALRGRPAPHTRAVSLSFALFDDEARIGAYRGGADLFSLLARGEVALHAGDAALRIGAGPPFLVLTDLVRGARELIAACEDGEARWSMPVGGATAPLQADLRDGELRHGPERLTCRPLELARAFLEGALDFAGAVRARNPAQHGNPYLASLAETATERLAHLEELEAGDLFADGDRPGAAPRRAADAGPPLSSAGTLKRLRYRSAWAGLDAGMRPRALCVERGCGAAAGGGGGVFFDPATGAVRARHAADAAQLGGALLLSTRGSRLEGFTLDGAPRFLRIRSGGPQAAITSLVGPAAIGPRRESGLVCVFDRHLVAGVLAQTGRTAWQFEAPQAGRVFAVAGRERVYVAADNGAVYGLDAASGRVAFRVRTGCAFATPLALGAQRVVGVGRKDGALQLVAIDAASGRPRAAHEVAMLAAGTPVVARGLLLVAGVAQGSASLLALRRDGATQFTVSLPGGKGLPALAASRERVFVVQRDGAVACLDLQGRVLWSAAGTGRELERALAPCVRRGVVVVPGEPVRVYDAERGALVCELPAGRGLSAMSVGRDLSMVLFDDDGIGAAYRVATHLSVV